MTSSTSKRIRTYDVFARVTAAGDTQQSASKHIQTMLTLTHVVDAHHDQYSLVIGTGQSRQAICYFDIDRLLVLLATVFETGSAHATAESRTFSFSSKETAATYSGKHNEKIQFKQLRTRDRAGLEINIAAGAELNGGEAILTPMQYRELRETVSAVANTPNFSENQSNIHVSPSGSQSPISTY